MRADMHIHAARENKFGERTRGRRTRVGTEPNRTKGNEEGVQVHLSMPCWYASLTLALRDCRRVVRFFKLLVSLHHCAWHKARAVGGGGLRSWRFQPPGYTGTPQWLVCTKKLRFDTAGFWTLRFGLYWEDAIEVTPRLVILKSGGIDFGRIERRRQSKMGGYDARR